MLDWLRQRMGWYFGGLLAIVLVLLLLVALRGDIALRVAPVGNMLLVIATLIYAWLTYSLVQQAGRSAAEMRRGNEISQQMIAEMRESRKQAATPIVRATRVSGNADAYFFRLMNVGTSPALNVVVVVRSEPAGEGTQAMPVLGRMALMASGQEMQVEARLWPYTAPYLRGYTGPGSYHIIATYENPFGEHLESTTVFPMGEGDRLPLDPTNHILTRRGG